MPASAVYSGLTDQRHRKPAMKPVAIAADPFALMMNPQAVLAAVAHSEHLQQLRSRVYRPLDKPLLPRQAGDANDFDRAIDAEIEADVDSFGDTQH